MHYAPMRKHAAPIIAAFLLLVPMLYVGSYFAIVTPGPLIILRDSPGGDPILEGHAKYRLAPSIAEDVFWPLEQIDRKVRPGVWYDVAPVIRMSPALSCP